MRNDAIEPFCTNELMSDTSDDENSDSDEISDLQNIQLGYEGFIISKYSHVATIIVSHSFDINF